MVEANNRLESTIYQLERMLEENKDKIPESDQENIKTLISEGKRIKDNADATKEEVEAMIDKIEKEMQDMAGKYQAANNASDASPADMVEDESSVDGEVIDADK